jgi:hypothetical protein
MADAEEEVEDLDTPGHKTQTNLMFHDSHQSTTMYIWGKYWNPDERYA